MKESAVQAKILQYLNSLSIYTVKTIVSNRAGVPDILCCVKGLFVAFEVKRAKGVQVSPLQREHAHRIRRAGGGAFVVHSVDEVVDILKQLYPQSLEIKQESGIAYAPPPHPSFIG